MLGWGTPIKVACVGNSITYGAGIVNRDKNSYPAQLQAYLGEKYEVRNFGRNGATALLKGDYPYMETEEYKQSLAFLPDIVFIKLGTNDSKPLNIKYKRKFKSDYLKLIRSYQELFLILGLFCWVRFVAFCHRTIISRKVLFRECWLR